MSTSAKQLGLLDGEVSPLALTTFSVSRHMVQDSGLLSKMTTTAWTVYTILRSYANPETGRSWPGNDRIGQIINRKHDAIGRGLQELENLGLIYPEMKTAGGHKTRAYYLIDRFPAMVLNADGGDIVPGQIAFPFVPSRSFEFQDFAVKAAVVPDPTILVNPKLSVLEWLRFTKDGVAVFALAIGPEKNSRPFFLACGAPVELVDEFYAEQLRKSEEEKVKRRASLRLAGDDDDL